MEAALKEAADPAVRVDGELHRVTFGGMASRDGKNGKVYRTIAVFVGGRSREFELAYDYVGYMPTEGEAVRVGFTVRDQQVKIPYGDGKSFDKVVQSFVVTSLAGVK